LNRRIVCGSCGKEGVVQAHDTAGAPRADLFVRLPKDREGYSHFRCPHCDDDLTVDPLDVAASPKSPMQGRSSFAPGNVRPAGRGRGEPLPVGRLLGVLALVGATIAGVYLACR